MALRIGVLVLTISWFYNFTFIFMERKELMNYEDFIHLTLGVWGYSFYLDISAGNNRNQI